METLVAPTVVCDDGGLLFYVMGEQNIRVQSDQNQSSSHPDKIVCEDDEGGMIKFP